MKKIIIAVLMIVFPIISFAGKAVVSSAPAEFLLGFSPWKIYENGYQSLVFQPANPGYYAPRSILVVQAPTDNPQEATLTAERPLTASSWNGTDFTDREWIDVGCEDYGGIDHNCYIESAAQGIGKVSPIRIGFWNSNAYSTVDKVPYANYFDPSGAVAFGYGDKKYDKKIALQVASSTAPVIFSVDKDPQTHLLQVMKGGCMIMKDMTGNGFTQIYTQNGQMLSKVATTTIACN